MSVSPINGSSPSSADYQDLDNSPEGKAAAQKWLAITDGNQQEAADMARATVAAEIAGRDWDKMKIHGSGINMYDPSHTLKNWNSLSKQDQEALTYLSHSSTLLNAGTTGGGGGVNSGPETGHALLSFAKQSMSDLDAATKAYSSYEKNNPNADGTSKAMAQSGAIVMANQSLIENAGVKDGDRASKTLTEPNLSAFTQDSGVDLDVKKAASTWAANGMLRSVSNFGQDPAAASTDGSDSASRDAIGTWLSKSAPGNLDDTLSFMQSAAAQGVLSGVDMDKIEPDILTDTSGKYSAQQKAAALIDLQNLAGQMQAGYKEGYWGQVGGLSNGLSEDFNTNLQGVQSAISQLAGDPDVQNYLSGQISKNVQAQVANDPALQSSLQDLKKNGIDTGAQLKDLLSNTKNVGDALNTFATRASLVDQALGADAPDLQHILGSLPSENSQKVQDYFTNQLQTGKELQDSVNSGTDLATAAAQFASHVAVAKQFLGDKVTDADSADLQQNMSTIVSDHLLDMSSKGNQSAVMAAISDGHGHLDEKKLTAIIDQAAQQDPSLLKTSDGQSIDPNKIVAGIKGLWSSIQGEQKLADKVPSVANALGGASDTYKKGAMHAVSAILGGLVLGTKAGSGGDPTQLAGYGIQIAGNLMEASAKYSTSIIPKGEDGKPDGDYFKNLEKGWKDIESVGKVVGGTGGVIAGVMGIIGGVQSLNSGDKTGGALSLTSGVLGLVQAGLGIAEGGAAMFGAAEAATTLGALGASAGVAGGVLAVGVMLYSIIEGFKNDPQDQYYANIDNGFYRYDINGYNEQPVVSINENT